VLWVLNSAALRATGLIDSADPAVQRDEHGRATGRIVRGDHLLRVVESTRPQLADVGRLLASYGVTGVTDATPRLDVESVVALHAAQDGGALPQRMLLLGAPLEAAPTKGIPWKIVVDEMQGLDPAGLADEVVAAHGAGRPVAIHCTSRAETVLAVTTLRETGMRPGDRLEHAGILPPEFDSELASSGVTVVTQPHFITERGDDYLRDVEAEDHGLLYRCKSLVDHGVPVGFGTDAPFGRPDPWAVIAAAGSRRTKNGVTISAAERIEARRALRAFTSSGLTPGGPPRQMDIGAVADLCLLDEPLDAALSEPMSDRVAATITNGAVVYQRQR
jgi:predicted amidohydrolase YtcJ